MSEHGPQTDPRQSQAENADDVFARLRRRVQEIRSGNSGEIDPKALARKLTERAKALRGRIGKAAPTGQQISFLAFSHGPQRYGLPIADIVEVQRLQDYTPVPGAPRFVSAVVHWRGTILALVDLVKLFGIIAPGLIDERFYVVVEAAGRRVGILAGDIEELCTAPMDQVKSAPEWPTEVPREWVIGVYDQNRLILRVGQIIQDQRVAGEEQLSKIAGVSGATQHPQ